MNFHIGIGRYIYTENVEFGAFLGTSLIALGAVYLTTAVIILWNIDFFAIVLGLPRQVIVLILIVVLGQIAESLFSQLAIFNQHSFLLLKVTSIKALVTFMLTIALLLSMKSENYLAVIYSDAVASFAIAVFVMFRLQHSVRWAFHLHHLRYLMKYSLPLIPYMLSLTLLSQFDRVLIDRFFGKEETGLYSLAYNIGILLLLVVTAVLNTFTPAFFEALNKKEYSRVIESAKNIFSLAVVVTAVLVLFGQELAALVIPSRYASAFDLIPIVSIGGLCFVIFQIWVRVIAYANRTILISFIAIGATWINLSLNYWLIPIAGYKIAAITTVLAYLIMSLGCLAMLNYVIRLFKVNTSREMLYVAALAALTLLFQNMDLSSHSTLILKSAILGLLVWHLKPSLVALLDLQKIGAPG